MDAQAELDTWRRQWQAAPAERGAQRLAADLRRRVERQSRWLLAGLTAPVLVTVLIGGGAALHAQRTGQAADAALAVETWLFILVTWAGSLGIARGTWRPLGETTAAFVELSIRRRRANLRAIPFAICLYVGQLAVVVLVKLHDSTADAVLTSWPTVLLAALGLPALLTGGRWYARKQRVELRHLVGLRRQLTTDAD